MTELRTAVLIGSTREGRVGDAVGHWFAERARERGGLDVVVVDLAEYELPVRLPATPTAEMTRFAHEIDRADAFVVVTPEYNRSFPASLKLAIDCAYDEWHAKPAGFVSYGCRSAGLQAVEQLRSVFTELHVATVRDTVSFDLFCGGPDGPSFDDDELTHRADTLLDQLVWWAHALRTARTKHPYSG